MACKNDEKVVVEAATDIISTSGIKTRREMSNLTHEMHKPQEFQFNSIENQTNTIVEETNQIISAKRPIIEFIKIDKNMQ